MTLLYKTTHMDGSSWHDPTSTYEPGRTYRAAGTGRDLCTSARLHACRTPEVAASFVWGVRWPYRLWQVEGRVLVDNGSKVGLRSLTVTAELPVHLCWGPKGLAVESVVRRAGRLTVDEVDRLYAAWSAAGNAARSAARSAAAYAAADAYVAGDAAWIAAKAAARDAAADAYVAGDAARDAAKAAARYAAWNAAWACVVVDLVGRHGFTQAHMDTLLSPWRSVFGPVEPLCECGVAV